jgi:hypothetical protein
MHLVPTDGTAVHRHRRAQALNDHRRRRGGRRGSRAPWRSRFVVGLALVLSLLLVAAALAVFRYFPALDEARTLQAQIEAIASRAQVAGLAIDRRQVDALDRDLAAARHHLGHLIEFVAHDPLIAAARAFPPTAANVRDADAVTAAAGDILAAAEDGLAIARRFVEIKEEHAADTKDPSSLAELVELMVTSRQSALGAAHALDQAGQTLATVPQGRTGPIENARVAMVARLATYGPIVDAYVSASARLPAILGWEKPRRYLVLTQDPAELRPTGGFTGSYGIIVFDRGRVTERNFRDVFLLDLPWDYRFVRPPQELADYLLGPKQPWQLADANWSPNFPTSAQDAARLYANESGDTAIDGVLGITTYTIDELLKATGPVTVPDYGVTIASGETTLKVLQLTRRTQRPNDNRKAVLSALADRLLATVFALPPARWGELLGHAGTFQAQRLLLAWFRDPADQTLAAHHGFDGAVRMESGDYLYPVDSNVAPASKLNALTTRSLELDVDIDRFGNARDTLNVTWDNRILSADGALYRALPDVGRLRILGMYFRLLAPDRSRIESISGGTFVRLTAPAVVEQEAGRMAIGTYLKVRPGKTSLRYSWVSPYAATMEDAGATYRLTIQKQPGLLPGPFAVRLRVPIGAHITSASQGFVVSGESASLRTSFDRDLILTIKYET